MMHFFSCVATLGTEITLELVAGVCKQEELFVKTEICVRIWVMCPSVHNLSISGLVTNLPIENRMSILVFEMFLPVLNLHTYVVSHDRSLLLRINGDCSRNEAILSILV